MKAIRISTFVSLAAAIFAAACDPAAPEDENAKLKTEIFTSATDAVYTAEAAGHYALTLKNSDSTLRLDFFSSVSQSESPLPDNGSYTFGADGAAGTFSGESLWVSGRDGITRKLAGGSFTFLSEDGSCTIEGTVGGSDEAKLKFIYSGALTFTDNSKGDEATCTTLFTTVADPYFLGNKNGTGTGRYSLLFKNASHTLYLEFASSICSGDTPMPDNGTYTYSDDGGKGTFGSEGYWLSEEDGITRKLAGGSFLFEEKDGVCRIAGTVGGRDGASLRFSFEGALAFADINGEPDAGAIKCLGCYGTYYGPYYIPSASDFYIVLYDTVHAKEGDPYTYRICLDFSSKRTAGSLMPEMGTYRADTDGDYADGRFIPGMLSGDGTMWGEPNSSGTTTLYMAVDGFFTIRQSSGSNYQIFGTLKDRYGAEISFDYTGRLSFNNDAPGPYTALTSDLDMDVFYANQKCYYASESIGQWKLYFYTEDSWTSKGESGNFIAFDIPLEPELKSVPAGTYTVSKHVLYPESGNFIPGYVYTESDALGSWLAAGTKPWAPVKDGTLTITDNADGTQTAKFDVTDDDFVPHRIRGSFTGNIPLTSDSEIKTQPVPVRCNGRRR